MKDKELVLKIDSAIYHLDAFEFMTYAFILLQLEDEDSVEITLDRFAESLEATTKTIQKRIKSLKEKGYISIESGVSRRPNKYSALR